MRGEKDAAFEAHLLGLLEGEAFQCRITTEGGNNYDFQASAQKMYAADKLEYFPINVEIVNGIIFIKATNKEKRSAQVNITHDLFMQILRSYGSALAKIDNADQRDRARQAILDALEFSAP